MEKVRQGFLIFRQTERKEEYDSELGDFRGLESKQPPGRAVPRGADAGNDDKHQKQSSEGEKPKRELSQPVVIKLGQDEHAHRAHDHPADLLFKIPQAVAEVGKGRRCRAEQHDESKGHEQAHRHQERIIDIPLDRAKPLHQPGKPVLLGLCSASAPAYRAGRGRPPHVLIRSRLVRPPDTPIVFLISHAVSSILPPLLSKEIHQRAERRCDQCENNDHFLFAPATHLKVMVDGAPS